jgi:hypothetical protein
MKDSYRDFGKYLKSLYRWMYKIPKNSFIRLYTDEITFNDRNFQDLVSKSYNKLEIFIYDYPEFKDSDGYHDGTFGTMMRFLPFFDKNLVKEYKVKYIWISDVDIYANFLNFDVIQTMKNQKCMVAYYAKACYNVPWASEEILYPMGAGKIIVRSNVEISEYRFNKFLKDCVSGKYKNLRLKILEKFKALDNKEKIKSVENSKYICYGFDEYYCNEILNKNIV